MSPALLATIGFCVFYGLQIVLQQLFVKSSIFPLHLDFLTNLTSFVLLSIYFFIFNKKHLSFKMNKKIVGPFLLATFLWIAADLSTIFGLKISSSLNLSVISRLQVFITYLLAIFFFKESFTKNKIVAVILSFIGSLILVYNFQSAIKINLGDLLFFTFAVTISISGLLRQKITKDFSPFQMTYMMFGISAFVLGLITFIFFPITHIKVPGFILFNAVIGLAGFILVNYAISKGGATFFSVGSSLLPFVTAIFSFLILKSLPVYNQIIGAAIVIFSIFLFQKKHANH